MLFILVRSLPDNFPAAVWILAERLIVCSAAIAGLRYHKIFFGIEREKIKALGTIYAVDVVMVTGSFGLMGKLVLKDQNAKELKMYKCTSFIRMSQRPSCLKMKVLVQCN